METIIERLEQVEWEKQQPNGQVLLSPPWELFVLGVSILSVFNLFLGWVLGNPTTLQLVLVMDTMLTVVFAADVIRRLVIADDNRRYLTKGKGWIDVLSTFPLLRIFRLFRILRVFHVMRRLGGASGLLRAIFKNKASGGLLMVLMIAILVLEFGSMAILWAESGAQGATILNGEDAIWYVVVTMSTVGYGDMVPVTTVGRVIGAVIIVVGVGVFGTLTGFLANAFLAPSPGVPEAPSPRLPPAEAPGAASDTDPAV